MAAECMPLPALSGAMTLPEALNVADMQNPVSGEAHEALKVVIDRLGFVMRLLGAIRDHAGVSCSFADLPEAVAALRRGQDGER